MFQVRRRKVRLLSQGKRRKNKNKNRRRRGENKRSERGRERERDMFCLAARWIVGGERFVNASWVVTTLYWQELKN